MTKYEYEYYSVSLNWPNTNTNIIRFPKNDRIRIWILFGFPKMTEYNCKYYSDTQKWPNTNIILLTNNDRIQISFGFPKMIEYYIQIKTLLSFPNGRPPRPVLSLTRWCYIRRVRWWLKLTTNANSFQSIWLIRCDVMYMRMICSFGAKSSFGSAKFSKKNTHPLIFFRGLVDPVIRKVKVQWQIFMCPFMKDWGPLCST